VWRSSLHRDGAHVPENRLRRTAVVPAPLGRGGTPDVRPAERHHHHLFLGQDHRPATTTRQLQLGTSFFPIRIEATIGYSDSSLRTGVADAKYPAAADNPLLELWPPKDSLVAPTGARCRSRIDYWASRIGLPWLCAGSKVWPSCLYSSYSRAAARCTGRAATRRQRSSGSRRIIGTV
jgi:hypothetical protein